MPVVVKHLKNEDPLMSDLKGDVNIESDCDPIGPVGINYNAVSGITPLWKKTNVLPAPTPPPQWTATLHREGPAQPSIPDYAKPQTRPLSGWLKSLALETAEPHPGPSEGRRQSLMPETAEPHSKHTSELVEPTPASDYRGPAAAPALLFPSPTLTVSAHNFNDTVRANSSRSRLRKSLSRPLLPPSATTKDARDPRKQSNNPPVGSLLLRSRNPQSKKTHWKLRTMRGVYWKMKNKFVRFSSLGRSPRM